MAGKKPLIGLAGGVGAGKSSVAAEFARQGCVVVDSDRLNHEVLATPDVRDTLAAWWGPGVIGPDGWPDRRRIAEIVFADPAQRRRLEQLVYPLINQRRVDIINTVEQDQAVKAIILDSPLLFESSLARLCDTIIFVEASLAVRLQRLQQSRLWSAEQVGRREQWQEPLDYKRSRSEFVIHNDGPPEELRSQVTDILTRVTSRFTPVR